jgi:hypothetical protein
MGGLGGWLTNATRAVAGRIRTEDGLMATPAVPADHWPPTPPPQPCQPHAGSTDVTQPPRRRAGRANHRETRATSPPPTPLPTAPPAYYQKMLPGHTGAAISTFFDGTRRPPINYHRHERADVPFGIRCGDGRPTAGPSTAC